MISLRIVKVQPVFHFFDRYRLLLQSILQNKLLEVQEGSFMRHFLPNLYDCLPCVFSSESSTVGALGSLNNILHLEDLLNYRRDKSLERLSFRQAGPDG